MSSIDFVRGGIFVVLINKETECLTFKIKMIMSQKFVVVKRKNPLKPTQPAKYYAQAVREKLVDLEGVVKSIDQRSTYSIGELNGVIGEFLRELHNQLEEGNSVSLGELGCFRVTISTGKPVDDPKKFNPITCISRSRVRFLPGKDLRQLCKAMEFSLKTEEKKSAGKPAGGKTDDGTGEAPDPIG